MRKVFIFAFSVEGAVIYTYFRIYVFILQERNFIVAIRTTSVKVLESSRISSKVKEKSKNFDAKSPGKSGKKVLGSPGIGINFFGGNHDLCVAHLHNFHQLFHFVS